MKKQLLEKLISIIYGMTVDGNITVDRTSRTALRDLDKMLPQHGKVHDLLRDYVGDQPFSEFVLGSLYTRFAKLPYESGERPLQKIPGFENVHALCCQLVSEFSSLPEEYIFSLNLPDIFRDAIPPNSTLPFNKTIAIRGGGDTLNKWLPLTTGNDEWDNRIFGTGLLLIPIEQDWDGAFLQIKDRGFSGRFADVVIDHRVIETIKSFFGLWVAHGLIQRRFSYSPTVFRRKIRVHKHADKWELVHQIELDEASSRLIGDLYYDDFGGQFGDHRVKKALLTEIGKDVAKAFGHAVEAQRVFLAARWLFDSYANEDELMAFLQAMVTLEIILGENANSDKIGLNELLRNRCAYLIGENASDRASIMEQFSAIYEVRSHIVHRGKSRISAKERSLFYTLREYSKRVIRAELKLLPEATDYMKIPN